MAVKTGSITLTNALGQKTYESVDTLPSEVGANPILSGGEDNLTSIEIDDEKYNIPGLDASSASQGQFLVADGQGGYSWQTVPSANSEEF